MEETAAELTPTQDDVPMDPMQKIAAFLSQMPPNWELAEKHGYANGCINSSETSLVYDDPTSYCPCCQLPYVTEEHFYPICVDNTNLGDLGPGFPLFFIFMKYLTIYLLILTLIYFLPMAFLLATALNEIKDNLKPDDSLFALFSLGALIQHVGDEGYALDMEKRQKFINAFGFIYVYSIFFSAIFFAYIKTKLWQKISELDQSAFTPSDYCIMGSNMDFDGYSPEAIKKGVVEYFNDNYDGMGDKIVYVNPAYKIGEFYKLSTRYTELNKQKMMLALFKQSGEYSDDQMQEFVDLGDSAPEDYPKIKKGLCGKKPLITSEVDDEIKDVEAQIAEFEKQASDGDDNDDSKQQEAFTGIVFIVFKNPQDCLRVMQ